MSSSGRDRDMEESADVVIQVCRWRNWVLRREPDGGDDGAMGKSGAVSVSNHLGNHIFPTPLLFT